MELISKFESYRSTSSCGAAKRLEGRPQAEVSAVILRDAALRTAPREEVEGSILSAPIC